MPHLAAALAQRQLTLLVVAPQTQSPAGEDTGAEDGSLAFRIEASLREQRPDLALDLDTIDNSGQSVADVMPIVADRLAQRQVALVVWQAGTAEITRASPAARTDASLADAVRLVANVPADLILVDPDPDPALSRTPSAYSLETSLVQTADHPGVELFRQNPQASSICNAHGIARLIDQ